MSVSEDRHARALASKASAPYREVTVEAMILGYLIGIMLTASITYAGLILGFTIVGSEIAAILGWGILRGILRRSTIVENNINQTVASAVNAAGAGIIFTVPVLYLRGLEFSIPLITVACVAGALLGVAFIIPVRKQMIDLERLRFPSGTAVATILRSPGAGIQKSVLLGIGMMISGGVHILVQTGILPESVDLGAALGMPSYMANVWAISLMSMGAGFISGKAGFTVLVGGILAKWIVAPIAVKSGWIPTEISPGEIAGYVHAFMNRPLGIGMLIGGALMGIVLAMPSIKAAFVSLQRADRSGGSREELSIKFLYLSIVGAFIVLFLASYGATDIGFVRALIISVIGTAWLWLAGIIVAQCTGMTDWSPISGLALIAVTLMLVITASAGEAGSVVAAVLVGAAICVAISQCADMMQDLKTGYLVGARPVRQQTVQLTAVWLGPIIAIIVVGLIWKAYGFGPGTNIAAPQAQALNAAIEGVLGGDIPAGKYLAGGVLGAALSASGIHGLGVLVGLSMYLPLLYILPYGLGCVLNLVAVRMQGSYWVEDKGIPVAAGLIVGEALVGVIYALRVVVAGVGG